MESGEKEASPLPIEAVVMRGGLSTPDTPLKTALRHFDLHGEFAISCRSKPRMTADELAAIDPPIPAPRMRETTVGVIRGSGYDVVSDEPPPTHALIKLPLVPADDDYVTISALFSDERPNPVFRKEPR